MDKLILCLGAHPDDIELGCGATLAGSDTNKIGFTFTCHSAFHHILPEMLNSWDVLNIKYLPDWDQNHRHRELNRQSVLDVLIRLRDTFKPDLVYTHSSFDCHQDHKIIHQETVRAFKHSTILGYSLPWNEVSGSDYRYYNYVTYNQVKKKQEALNCYESQTHRTYFDNEYQKSILLVNGQVVNTSYAEKFEVIRYVNNNNSF